MLWLYLALIAYFLNAFSFVVDKYLLTSPIPRPMGYAFWVSILSVAAVALIPFGVVLISYTDFAWSVLSGAAFFSALLFFYTSIKHGDVSVSATTTGVFTVLFTYLFSYLILNEHLTGTNLYAFLFLLAGIAFLGFAGRRILKFAIPAGMLFALSLVIIKLMFNHLGFINGLFWTRAGFVISACVPFLIFSSARRDIIDSLNRAPSKSKWILVLNKVLVGFGFILLYKAIQVGDVAAVNSLQGLQFMFVLLMTLAVRKWLPGFEAESSRLVTSSKVVGVVFVTIGFLLFALVK